MVISFSLPREVILQRVRPRAHWNKGCGTLRRNCARKISWRPGAWNSVGDFRRNFPRDYGNARCGCCDVCVRSARLYTSVGIFACIVAVIRMIAADKHRGNKIENEVPPSRNESDAASTIRNVRRYPGAIFMKTSCKWVSPYVEILWLDTSVREKLRNICKNSIERDRHVRSQQVKCNIKNTLIFFCSFLLLFFRKGLRSFSTCLYHTDGIKSRNRAEIKRRIWLREMRKEIILAKRKELPSFIIMNQTTIRRV